MTSGIDVASPYQTAAQVTAEVKAGRAAFVFVKATEGGNYASAGHAAQVAAARAVGADVGHYHFLHPGDPVAQAHWFLSVAHVLPGDAVAVDAEDEDPDGSGPQPSIWAAYSWAYRAASVATFIATVNAETRARCVRYHNGYWLGNLTKYAGAAQRPILTAAPLWFAAPGKPAGQPGISGWTIHQYSTAGGIDRNYMTVPWSTFAIPTATPTSTGVDDMSAADVAAINAHTDAVITQVFASLSHGTLPGGAASNGVGHDQILNAIASLPQASSAPLDTAAVAQAVVDALLPHLTAGTDPDVIAGKVADLLATRLQA